VDISSKPRISEDTIDVPIRDPETGKLTDIVITAYPRNTRFYRKAFRRVTNETMGSDDVDDKTAEFLAGITTGWKNIQRGTEDVQFSSEAARDLYLEFYWLSDQLDSYTSTPSNFPKPPKKS